MLMVEDHMQICEISKEPAGVQPLWGGGGVTKMSNTMESEAQWTVCLADHLVSVRFVCQFI